MNYSSRVNAGSSTIVKIIIPDGCSGSYTVSADSGLSITKKTDFSNQQASFTVDVNSYGYKYLTITVFSQCICQHEIEP